MKVTVLGLLAAAMLAGPMGAVAGAVSYGALSSNDDGSIQIITDSLNDLQWMRWNGPQYGMTYAQTMAAIAPGGVLAGWAIARNAEAQLFSDALFAGQANACTVSNNIYCRSGVPSSTLTSLLGDTGSEYSDDVLFLSDNGVGDAVGIMQLYVPDSYFLKYNEFTSIDFADLLIDRVGWLLYRPASVPEPGTLALLGLGLAGLGLSRRRRAN